MCPCPLGRRQGWGHGQNITSQLMWPPQEAQILHKLHPKSVNRTARPFLGFPIGISKLPGGSIVRGYLSFRESISYLIGSNCSIYIYLHLLHISRVNLGKYTHTLILWVLKSYLLITKKSKTHSSLLTLQTFFSYPSQNVTEYLRVNLCGFGAPKSSQGRIRILPAAMWLLGETSRIQRP